MNTTSASPSDGPPRRETLVWDLPVRVFHWLMVLAFAGAWLTAESERWRQVHVTLGYTMAGLVAFRLAWGLVGTRWARFSSFVRGPRAVGAYVAQLVKGEAPHSTGHNPAGAVAVLLLLGLTVVVVASGWALLEDVGGDGLEEVHEAVATAMLFVVGIHVAGVALGSWLHRENLVKAMITGRKSAPPGEGAAASRAGIGMVILAVVAAFWWFQWRAAPSSGPVGHGAPAPGEHRDADD